MPDGDLWACESMFLLLIQSLLLIKLLEVIVFVHVCGWGAKQKQKSQ